MFKQKKIIKISTTVLLLGLFLLTISGRTSCFGKKDKTNSGGSITELPGINAPSNLSATAFSTTQINLSWQDNSTNEDGFQIERKREYFEWEQIATVSRNVNFYSDAGILVGGTIYYYRIQAFNTVGDLSAYSNEVSIFSFDSSWLPNSLVMVTARRNHSFILGSNGTLWAWGRNDYGQLGVGDTYNRIVPILIGTDWSAVICGSTHTLAIKTNRTLWSWGDNIFGQLGMGDTLYVNYEPFQVDTNSDWSKIAAGGYHSLGVKNNGTIWSWGRNNAGQLGLGDTEIRTTPSQIGTNSDWFIVTAGEEDYTIAIKTNNTIWSWGSNSSRQLGFSPYGGIRTTPSQIDSNSDWDMIVAGYSHNIAHKTNGTLWGWGGGSYGDLGLSDTYGRSTPSQIGTDSDWLIMSGTNMATASAGESHTIVLKTNNTAWSCGYNYYGQLGVGDNIDRYNLTQIGNDTDWLAIASGNYHNIGIKINGTIWSWGSNNNYQLGFGDTVDRNMPSIFGSPIPPSSLSTTLISLSQIDISWTDNSNNESGFRIERKTASIDYVLLNTVGPNITYYSDTNIPPLGITYYYRIRAYNSFGNSSCSNEKSVTISGKPLDLIATVISSSRIDLSWTNTSSSEDGFKIERKSGRSNTYGQITTVGAGIISWSDTGPFSANTYYYYRIRAYNGFGDSDYSNEVYQAISGDWSLVFSGWVHKIGIKTDKSLWGWGSNDYGQLGIGDMISKNIPIQIGTAADSFLIITGCFNTFKLKSDGALWALGGDNYRGQLGLGDSGEYTNRNTPTQIGTESNWSMLAAGNHTLGLKTNGTLWSWGWNWYGQLGLGEGGTIDDTRTTPSPIGTTSDWVKVVAGDYHNLGLKSDNTLWVWGYNYHGQLGLGDTINRYTPTQIDTASDWLIVSGTNLSGLNGHSLSLKTNKILWIWGYNNYGQLGLGDTIARYTPTQLGTTSDWSMLAAGLHHTASIKTNGTLWVWGRNQCGQLGLGNTLARDIPTQVGIASDWSVLSAAHYHTVSIKINNTLWVWGYNECSYLGLGDTIDRNTPTLVGE